MSFTTDKQTLDDLNIFGKRGKKSVYNIFNRTNTRGGAEQLEQMFRYPLDDRAAINKRSHIIRFFQSLDTTFPIKSDLFDIAEQYLANTDNRARLAHDDNSLERRFRTLIGSDTEYQLIAKGVIATVEIIRKLRDFVQKIGASATETPYIDDINEMKDILETAGWEIIFNKKAKGKLAFEENVILDKLLRYQHHDKVKKLLYNIYTLDVYMAVASVATSRKFVFPVAIAQDKHSIFLTNVYHPQLDKPVANTIQITPESNIVFLTGANMAGKSTFMKSVGIALFLAHMGFPVPAAKMEFSVRDGIFTTINLPDNLSLGYSHFYVEVLRVKKVAEQLRMGKNMFIIFDELFRGTNVKDAYEATVAITSAFAQKRNCMFIVSTHIMEAGDTLKPRYDNINFVYLPTRMKGQTPVYTYTLETGISSDRHGMLIINNEGIPEILKNGKQKLAQELNAEPLVPDESQKSGSIRPLTESSVPGFQADKQTLDDLNILGKYRAGSMFGLFNRVKTSGGEKLLDSMFRQPLRDAAAINRRSDLFRYFQQKRMAFPFDTEQFSLMENYLRSGSGQQWPVSAVHAIRRKLLQSIGLQQEYSLFNKGFHASVEVLRQLKAFLNQLQHNHPDNPFREEIDAFDRVYGHKKLGWVGQLVQGAPISLFRIATYDHLLRNVFKEDMKTILQLVYQIDVCIAVSDVARSKELVYAHAVSEDGNTISIADCRHPGIEKAIGNSIGLGHEKNMLFLTGANMAGKSTLMKSFGIAVYLAHMGFPVAAREMTFSVRDGIYSSINVPDDLNLGYSHFYAEVLRVKKVAEEVASGKNLIVIFDELFKGTNVKDAYDATLAISRAFAAYSNCSFIISTHIVEVGEALGADGDNVRFAYMPTVMHGRVPTYPYQLTEGISDDKHGMMIIENEGILNIIAPEKKQTDE